MKFDLLTYDNVNCYKDILNLCDVSDIFATVLHVFHDSFVDIL